MQSSTRLQPQPDRFEVFAGHPAATDLRRRAWEALSDLGLTDEEIAAYYRIELGDPRAFRAAGRGTVLPQ